MTPHPPAPSIRKAEEEPLTSHCHMAAPLHAVHCVPTGLAGCRGPEPTGALTEGQLRAREEGWLEVTDVAASRTGPKPQGDQAWVHHEEGCSGPASQHPGISVLET